MSKIHRSRPAISAFAAVLMLTVSAPIAVHGQDEDLALAPVPAASWDETSGYGAVEAIRAEPDVYVVPGAGTTANAASGSDSVEAIRLSIVQHALQASDLGSCKRKPWPPSWRLVHPGMKPVVMPRWRRVGDDRAPGRKHDEPGDPRPRRAARVADQGHRQHAGGALVRYRVRRSLVGRDEWVRLRGGQSCGRFHAGKRLASR